MAKEQKSATMEKTPEYKKYLKWLLTHNKDITYEEYKEYQKQYKIQEAKWISEIFG